MQLTKMEESDESANPPATDLPPFASGNARDLGDLCYDALSRYGFLSLLLLLLALVFIRSVSESHLKVIWYDEVFSVIVATQPTWHRFALAMPADGNPPLYPLLTRLSIHLFGLSDVAIRLPAMLSFLAALFGIYVFVRKECGVVFGLLAVVLTFSESGWTYSYEARPYALLLAFMMLALVSWQSAANAAEATPPRPRRLALAGLAVGIAGSILSHGIGLIEVGFPLLLGEAVRLYRTRRIDWPVLATALSIIPALAIVLPMMRRTSALLLIYTHAGMHPLTLSKVYAFCTSNIRMTMPLLLNSNLVEIVVIAILLTWVPPWLVHSRAEGLSASDRGTPAHPSAESIAAAFGASLLIPATMLFMMFTTGYYNCRYGIGSIAGVALLGALMIGRQGRRQTTICLGLMALLVLLFVHGTLTAIRQPSRQPAGFAAIFSAPHGGLPIVISDPFNYALTWWYAPPSMKNQIVYLTDKPTAIERGYVVTEVALVEEKPLISARMDDYYGFIAAQDHFLLDTDGDIRFLFLKDRLESAGYRSTLLADDGFNHLYDMQRSASPGTINSIMSTR